MVYCYVTDFIRIKDVKDYIDRDLLEFIFGKKIEVSMLEYTKKIIEFYKNSY